ncbi:MAG: hypothetical protein RPR97_04875 [Colwellia sp.]|jgi:hypothetical protein
MSNEFDCLKNYAGSTTEPAFQRERAVRAALVLINSRISACDNNSAMAEALDPTILSKLADNIEAALKNTD